VINTSSSELGPVLAAHNVGGTRRRRDWRACSARLRVTEQIDATCDQWAPTRFHYLVVPHPRLFVADPRVTIMADFQGIVGGYCIGVIILGIDRGGLP